MPIDKPIKPKLTMAVFGPDRDCSFSCRPIEKKSLDRFMPMYNVAVNLCTKKNDNLVTFILLFDCHRPDAADNPSDTLGSDCLRLYAIRTFIDMDAKRVKDMLDYAYFDGICRCLTQDNRSPVASASTQTYLDNYLLREWQRQCRCEAKDNHNDEPTLILPSLYCYVFDSASYSSETLLAAYANLPALADLNSEREQFADRVSHYMKMVNPVQEINKMATNKSRDDEQEAKILLDSQHKEDSQPSSTASDYLFGFDPTFYFNPDDSQKDVADPLALPAYQAAPIVLRGVDYDQFITYLMQQKKKRTDQFACCRPSSLPCSWHVDAWLTILGLCDSRLFSSTRLERDFPCQDRHMPAYRRVKESLLCTLAMQHFCARNKINDIIHHVVMAQYPQHYRDENAYLRNFSSYCHWQNYLDVKQARALAAELGSDKILLEWLENAISVQALQHYSQVVLGCALSLVPSHQLSGPPATYHTLTDFNFHYFFISCQPQRTHLPPLCDNFSDHYQNWCAVMRANLERALYRPVLERPENRCQKRTTRVSLADIIPPSATAGTAKRAKMPDSNDKTPAAGCLPIRALAYKAHQEEPTKKASCAADRWVVVIDQRRYGVLTPRSGATDLTDNDQVIGDLDSKTAKEMAKIRIISFHQEKQPRNSAFVKKWYPNNNTLKKKDNEQNGSPVLLSRFTNKHSADVDSATPSPPANQTDKPNKTSLNLPTISQIMEDFQRVNNPQGGTLQGRSNIEQLLFLELFLTCCDAKHTLLINGNPGTGKTTVMMNLVKHLGQQVICLLPTKILRERMINTITTMTRQHPHALPSPETNVITFSALVKRLMQYRLSPQVYSKMIKYHLPTQRQRLFDTIQPAFLDNQFFPRNQPFDTINYPFVTFIDEYNLIDWHQHFLIGEACEKLYVGRVLYGDSGQSSPIKSKNDNAEMISLRCALTVQFLDNKRIMHSRGTLRELLSDQIWNWRSNNDNSNVYRYVRSLLHRYLHHLINPHVRLTGLDSWFDALSRLLDWYDNKPCRRNIRTIGDMCAVLNLIPTLSLPCIISLKNCSSDRVNYWLSRAIRDYVIRRCQEAAAQDKKDPLCPSKQLADNYCIVVRRNVHATHVAYQDNAAIIETKGESYQYIHGMIADDPWCAELTLILGAVYRFIGTSIYLERETLLQLIAFLPEEDKASPYCCQRYLCQSCDRYTATGVTPCQLFTGTPTLGCGAPIPCDGSQAPLTRQQRLPRLLMRRVYNDSPPARRHYVYNNKDNLLHSLKSDRCDNHAGLDAGTSQEKKNTDNQSVVIVNNSSDFGDIFIINRAYYTLTRCSSVWTPSVYADMDYSREGMRLYGYPLILNAAMTSYRVQGETIAKNDVYIDFERMGKEQALVALSRVRRFEQICGVINIDQFGR